VRGLGTSPSDKSGTKEFEQFSQHLCTADANKLGKY